MDFKSSSIRKMLAVLPSGMAEVWKYGNRLCVCRSWGEVGRGCSPPGLPRGKLQSCLSPLFWACLPVIHSCLTLVGWKQDSTGDFFSHRLESVASWVYDFWEEKGCFCKCGHLRKLEHSLPNRHLLHDMELVSLFLAWTGKEKTMEWKKKCYNTQRNHF